MSMMDIKIKEPKSAPPEDPIEEVTLPVEIKEEEVEVAEKAEGDQAQASQAKKLRQKKIRRIIVSLMGVSLFFLLTTVYSQYQVYVHKKLADAALQPEVPVTPTEIMDAVARHIFLPEGTPQIASVQDAKKLNNSQVFFKDAMNGDVVLVYDTTIILYRPSKDILVAVGDIAVPEN